jgi:hypothetical protein
MAVVACAGVLVAGALLSGAVAAAPGVSPTPAAVRGPSGCSGSTLTITVEETNEWMLHEDAVYVVTNRGPSACVLAGFPSVVAYHDTTGHPTPASRADVAITDQGSAHAVRLRRGARAGFVISDQINTNRTAPCPLTEFVITLPNQARHVTIPSVGSIPVCRPEPYPGAFAVSPIEPFSAIPHPGRKG